MEGGGGGLGDRGGEGGFLNSAFLFLMTGSATKCSLDFLILDGSRKYLYDRWGR